MSSARPRFSLELFKFATYLSIPIAMTVAFAANPENLETIIKRHAYVVYPPEGPKPPTNAEMKKIDFLTEELMNRKPLEPKLRDALVKK